MFVQGLNEQIEVLEKLELKL